MKNFLLYLILGATIATLSSCSMDLKTYNDPTNRVAFVYKNDLNTDYQLSYSFAYQPADVTEHIIELRVTAIGFLSDQPRTVSVRQTNSETYAAQQGVHYEMANEFTIPANETGVTIPIKFLRDPSLKEAEYTLVLSLVANDDFQLGSPNRISKKFLLADILTKPDEWNRTADAYLGPWGKEKYKLMIEAAAPYHIILDTEWLKKALPDYPRIMAWRTIFDAKLIEKNAELGEAGPLTEEDGTIVVFRRS